MPKSSRCTRASSPGRRTPAWRRRRCRGRGRTSFRACPRVCRENGERNGDRGQQGSRRSPVPLRRPNSHAEERRQEEGQDRVIEEEPRALELDALPVGVLPPGVARARVGRRAIRRLVWQGWRIEVGACAHSLPRHVGRTSWPRVRNSPSHGNFKCTGTLCGETHKILS